MPAVRAINAPAWSRSRPVSVTVVAFATSGGISGSSGCPADSTSTSR
jgi:hypothetical protein